MLETKGKTPHPKMKRKKKPTSENKTNSLTPLFLFSNVLHFTPDFGLPG